MKIKVEIDIEDLVEMRGALVSALTRIETLMNLDPKGRVIYEFDHKKVQNGKKILAKMINNE